MEALTSLYECAENAVYWGLNLGEILIQWADTPLLAIGDDGILYILVEEGD